MSDIYLPADVQTGLPIDVPLKIQTDTDTRLNNLFNPPTQPTQITQPTANFSDFFNHSEKVQSGLPSGMSLSDAFFSDDPKYKSIATSIMQTEKDKDPFTKLNLGTDVRTPISQAGKYLNGEFGFDAKRDNEDYYAQYKNAGVTGVLENVGKFVGRTVGSAALKLGQGIAGSLAMLTAIGQDGNYWTNVSDNALVQGLTHAEDYMKNQLLPVYQNADATKMGVFHRMVSDNTFWTSDVSDGVAFMLSAIAPGIGLSKVGLVSKLGESAQLLNLGRLGAVTALDADKLLTTTLNTVQEAFFEAKGVHDGVMQKYSNFNPFDVSATDGDAIVRLPNGTSKKASELTTSEKQDIASTGARNDFFANVPILMFSNAFETKLLYKALGKSAPSAATKGINILDNLAAEAELPATGKLARFAASKAGFYAKHGAEGIFWEGLWEENAQLAAQRLNDDSVKYDYNSNPLTNFFSQLYKQTRNATRDISDPLYDKEAATSIGLGALIGLGAGTGVSFLTGEYSKQKKESSHLQELTLAAINNARDNWLSKGLVNPDGSSNDLKATAVAGKMNDIADKAASIEKIKDPELREVETKKAFVDYVNAVANAGKQDNLRARLANLTTATPEQLNQLGFDSTKQLVEPAKMQDFANTLMDIHDKVQKMDMGVQPKGASALSFAVINEDRKKAIYTNLAHSQIYTEVASTAGIEVEALKATVKTKDNMSVTDNFVDEYNQLKLRKNINTATIEYTQDLKVSKILSEMGEDIDNQLKDLEGHDYFTTNDYFKTLKRDEEGYLIHENKNLNNAINSIVVKSMAHFAANTNTAEYHKREADKLADPKTGFGYFASQSKQQSDQILQNAAKNQATQKDESAPVQTQTASTQTTTPEASTVQGVPLIQGPGFSTKEGVNEFQVLNPDGTINSTYPTQAEASAQSAALNRATFDQNRKEAANVVVPPEQTEETVEADNTEVQKNLEADKSEDGKFRKKLTSALSIASKAVKGTRQAPVLDEKGRPEFNANQDNIIDFGKVVPGTVINIQFDRENSIAPTYSDKSIKAQDKLYEEGKTTEGNIDNAAIKITYKDKSGREYLLGYMHDVQGARRLLAEEINVEEQIANLKAARTMIVSNPDTVYSVEVTATGFGILNKGDNRNYQSINDATEKDTNVRVGIKKGSMFITDNGEIPADFGNGSVIRGTKGIKEGASVILLPNNFNGKTVMIPIYIAKKSISTDPKITSIVADGISEYLNDINKDQKLLNDVRNYVFITDNQLVEPRLTNNGLFLRLDGEIFFRKQNIREMTMDSLLSQLLVNLNEGSLKNSKSYINIVKNSPAFQTTVFAQTRNGEKSYFHQHTIAFENPVATTPSSIAEEDINKPIVPSPAGDVLRDKPVVEESTPVEPSTKTKEQEEQDAIDALINGYEELGYNLGDFNESNDIPSQAVENIAAQESNLLIPGFTSFVEQDAIDSIAYFALNNKMDKAENAADFLLKLGEDNKQNVKRQITNQYNAIKALNEPLRNSTRQEALTSIRNETNLKLLIDNYDAIYSKATDQLEKAGLAPAEDGYYNDVAVLEEGMMVHDDDSEMQKNHFDTLSREVRKFISFIPEKVERNGKEINKANRLGLPSISNAKQIYNLAINSTSEDYNEPTYEGYTDMIEKLKDHPNPTVRIMAETLEKSNNWMLKFQFFTNMVKFKTNHIQQLLNVSKGGVDANNIEANRNQMARVVLEEMQQHFIETSPVVDKIHDQYGNNEYRVNREKALPYAVEFSRIATDNKSYYIKEVNGKVVGEGITKNAFDALYKILTDLGFDIQPVTFQRLISSKSYDNREGSPREGIKSYFLNGKLIDALIAVDKQGEEQSDTDKRNPFLGSTTTMAAIAKLEAPLRLVTKSDSFRSNGKNYYPFTRMSYVKGLFQQISASKASPEKGVDKFTPALRESFLDYFKGKSKTLQNIFNNPSSFTPEMWFMRGVSDAKGKDENTEVKNANDKEFIFSKIHSYQNGGKKQGYFYSDTYSDKTTRFSIKADKTDIKLNIDKDGNFTVDNTTLELFYNYVQGEADRIENVKRVNSTVDDSRKIPDYHDINGNEGIGKYFVVFNYLNASTDGLAKGLYDEQGNFIRNDEIKPIIMAEINKQLTKSIKDYQAKLEGYGFFETVRKNAIGEEETVYLAKGQSDTKYYNKLQGDKNFQGLSEKAKATYVVADYLLNHSLNSLDMLALTGDPALSPKVSRFGNKLDVNNSVIATLTEASKRNASLNAPFDQGISIKESYKVLFLNDVKINTNQFVLYTKLLGKKSAEAYRDGDMTDAQELTTVYEHLRNLLSVARISPEQLAMGLYTYDREDFDKNKAELQAKFKAFGITYNLDNVAEDAPKADLTGLLQPFKPVQRFSRYDENLDQVVETYIKTSSFPLVPALVKGTDFEAHLKEMKDNNIDRVNFKTGVKQGLINPQTLGGETIVGENGSNIIELKAEAWGEQVYNPEKEANIVTEGSQQQRLIFSDMRDDTKLEYKGAMVKASDLREAYRNNHKIILDEKMKGLFDELGISSANDINNFESLKKLSDIISREGNNRGYDANTIQSLALNAQGQFYIPLTFLPNSSQIQSLLAAVISNRILKNKLPGKSFIQGSEVILQTSGKVKVTSDITEAKNDIIWAKPEYKHKTKLDYLEKGKPAQIILPFFWRGKDGQLLKASEFAKDGFLDMSKIDPEMLEINGFRIPFAGLNSGMWFEVAGFLPEYMGDLVIVPAEVAAQMGSDYDVDKLFTYVKNHTADALGIRVDNSSARKQAENDIIDAHKAVYMHPDNIQRVLEPTSTSEIEEAANEFQKLLGTNKSVPVIFDPAHQDSIWLSNRAGQAAVGISANFNTLHAMAQSTHLFVKGASIKFKEGDKIFGDKDFDNATSKVDRDTYQYEGKEDTLYPTDFTGTNRLDRIHVIGNPNLTISTVIGNWLQASVDNAKLQVLGKAGLNRFNFNVAMTILLHGFDSKWAINFVNQPILKEYYAVSADLNDRFNKNFTSGKQQIETDRLIQKYMNFAGVKEFDNNYDAVSLNDLRDGIRDQNSKKVNEVHALVQLNVLKQYLSIDKISKGLANISANSKVEVSGLSKSFSEIAQDADDIEKLNEGPIGNTDRIKEETVSGIYLNVPAMVSDLFNNADNPIFGYSTPVYTSLTNAIQSIRGYGLNSEEKDNMYKEVKQFIYTHPNFNIYDNLQGVKSSILGLTKEDTSLVSLLKSLKNKYPDSVLLNQLSYTLKTRDNDPDILTMNNSDEDISLQMKQDWFDFFKHSDPEVVTFANRLTTYALLFANKEFGPSTLLKAIPFEVLKGIEFGEKLNGINKLLTKPELFRNFVRQYIQHNSSFASFVGSGFIEKNSEKTNNIISQFTLPNLTQEFVDKNKQLKPLIITGSEKSEYEYKPFARTYVNDKIGQILFELQSDGITYKRIDTLGSAHISEYDFTNADVKSAFPMQQSPKKSDKVAETILPASTEVSNDYATRFDGISSTSEALAQIQDDNSSADATPKEQMFYQLAKVLEPHVTSSIDFSTENRGVNGTYTGGETNQIKIYLNTVKNNNSGVLKNDLQGVILHEATHSAVNRYIEAQLKLAPSQYSSAFRRFNDTWNAYRKNFINEDKTETRGIKNSFLKAEMFKALLKEAKISQDPNIKEAFTNWDIIKKDPQKLLRTVFYMQESMKEAFNQHGVGNRANFDLVRSVGNLYQAVDTERVAQIVDYLGKEFTKEGLQSLKSKYYAYTNIKEFPTMTLTDTGFQEHLNSIPGIEGKKSLWENFKDFVKKVVSSFSNNSLLDNAIDAVLDLTTPEQSEEGPVDTTPEVDNTPVVPENTDRSISDKLAFEKSLDDKIDTDKQVDDIISSLNIEQNCD